MTKVKMLTLNGNMYNILHGTNSIAPFLLEILGIEQNETGRFRDIYLNEDGTKIILLTRNGGGNRESYQVVIDKLAEHPNYITDYDDDFDCTYAYVEFSVPDEYKDKMKQLSTGVKPKTLEEKTNETFDRMKKMSPKDVKKSFPEISKVLKKISKELK